MSITSITAPEDITPFTYTCFPAGTKIKMAIGSEKTIENIKVGDIVLSYNEERSELEAKQVEKVFKRKAKKLIKLSLSNGATISPTADHPFYLQGHWVVAGKLVVGDKLLKTDGSKVEITAIEEEFGEVVVYNFKVKDNHNYFAENILVHNADKEYDKTEVVLALEVKQAINEVDMDKRREHLANIEKTIDEIIKISQQDNSFRDDADLAATMDKYLANLKSQVQLHSTLDLSGRWQDIQNTNAFLSQLLHSINSNIQEIQNYEREKMTLVMQEYKKEISEINKLKADIIQASQSSKGAYSQKNSGSASQSLIAGILLDEAIRRDKDDDKQDNELKKILQEGIQITSQTNIQASASFIPISKNILSVSFGKAQMQLGLVVELVENGYLKKPDGWNEKTKYNIAANWLLDDSKAPYLIAARIENIYEWWKYPQIRGINKKEDSKTFDLSKKPEVLGTLYSIGLYSSNNIAEREPTSSKERGEGIARYGRIFQKYYGLKK